MIRYGYYILYLFLFNLIACIGTDILDDEIEAFVQIDNSIDTLELGESWQLQGRYFDQLGSEENFDEFLWKSTDTTILSVNKDGLVSGLMKGSAWVILCAEDAKSDSLLIAIGDTTTRKLVKREGKIRTTSSYELTGDFEVTAIGENLHISIKDNYKASSSLPGLYIYITNNPSNTSGAKEISAVTVFEGQHNYIVENVGILDYSHLLYYCKPFNVKVGDGKMD